MHGDEGAGSVLDAIGNTPIVTLRRVVPPGSDEVMRDLCARRLETAVLGPDGFRDVGSGL